MNDGWDSADIDQAKADLLAAGWIPKTSTIWKSPSGSLHAGPAGAWKTMKKAQNDAAVDPQASSTGNGVSCAEVIISQLNELKAQRPYRVAAPPPPPDTYPWGETMPQYAVLGIGAKAWAELEDIERRGQQSRNNEHSGMMISWGTFTMLMNVLRAIRLNDFRAVAAPPRERMGLQSMRRSFETAIDRDNDARALWMRDHERELRAWLTVENPAPPQWHPIETAPKDGSEVLVHDDGATFIAWWSEDDDAWMDSTGAPGHQKVEPPPQFWLPLPAPPAPPKESGE